MAVKCQVIIDSLERLAPRYLAEEWDNVGLLVGSPSAKIEKVMTSLDVTAAVVDRAVAENVNLIVSHHPLLFRAVKNFRTDTYLGAILEKLIKNDIAVYAAHTNLDSATGGVNDVLAEKLGLKEVKNFVSGYKEELVKLAVFVPKDYADAVRQALKEAGAGFTGNYSGCSFSSEGEGRFTAEDGAKPFIGTVGREECVAEVKVETIMPAKISARAIRKMLKAHPYEEPAFELLPLKTTGREWGLGRMGNLPRAMTLREAAEMVKEKLSLKTVRLAGDENKIVEKAALCSGAGAEFINKASFMGADLYITGDLKYHEAQKAAELGIGIIDAGHFGTEIPIAKTLQKYLAESSASGKWKIDVICDDVSKDAIITI